MGVGKFIGDAKIPSLQDIDGLIRPIENCNRATHTVILVLCHHLSVSDVTKALRKNGYPTTQLMIFHKQCKGFKKVSLMSKAFAPKDGVERMKWDLWTLTHP